MQTDGYRYSVCVARRPWLCVLLLATWVLHVNYMYAMQIRVQLDAPRAHGATHSSQLAPENWPMLGDTCDELPSVFVAVAMVSVGEYTNASLMQLAAPNTGVERNVIGFVMSIVRYNMSLLALTIDRAWLWGCEGDSRDPPSWLDVLAVYVPDMSSWRYGHVSSMKVRYLPDTIRVDLTGVRFTVSMRYDVHQFGVHAGSGFATITGVGSLWLDEISLRLVDVGEDNAVSIVCGGDIAIDALVFDGDYHATEGLFMGGGIQRPDLIGYICDGFETRNHNPLATGWQWLGPGEPTIGLRARVAGYIKTVCSAPTRLERACGRCVLPYAWPVAALRVTTVALNDDPIGFVIYSLVAVGVILCCICCLL